MSLAQHRLLREELTMAQRRELGQTIIHLDGVELVRGSVLVAEALREYAAIHAEGNEYLALSPFRSDYGELQRLIEVDLLEVGELLADTARMWLADLEVEQHSRDYAVMDAALAGESDEAVFELTL